ncbi:hypothetical protein ACL83_24765, partial [Salmonella enterica subsp. enterica serovar Saintpaul]|nr:hypothetical protein [Salmonella enterica subsp. enterica serovar Saintpaul]
MSVPTNAARFNATAFSRWLNGNRGRLFRIGAGGAWLALGLATADHWWGVAALLWSFLPLSAGLFDVCWVS